MCNWPKVNRGLSITRTTNGCRHFYYLFNFFSNSSEEKVNEVLAIKPLGKISFIAIMLIYQK